MWLYHEAGRSYVAGSYVAAILCAHASCERCLAGYLSLEDQLGKQLQRAGLGPLTQRAVEHGLVDSVLRQDLNVVNETRKVLAHFKPPLDPSSVSTRAFELAGDQDDIETVIDELLRDDAERALAAASRVVRGLGQLSGPRVD